MRLILLDLPSAARGNFHPVALSRPIFELRCGMSSLADKLAARVNASNFACFVPPYMAQAYAEQTGRSVNDARQLSGDDLLLMSSRVKAAELDAPSGGPSRAAFADDGELLYARITRDDLGRMDASSIDSLIASVRESVSVDSTTPATWTYLWDLILANADQLVADIAAAGRSGIEGTVEEPRAIRGSESDVFVAADAVVHPMVVIDAEHGPVYIDEGAEIHPFSRIEGPCYVGRKSILLGAKCREGNSIGPMCRIGGEVEESIIHGYSNKYHDGFLGHAYVGQWVNLGALTTNSDLKNDYSSVAVSLDGGQPIDTGSTKVGALIGDHTKTSIGTLFNTGAYVGAMGVISGTGQPLPKFIPSFSWFLKGVVTKGFGKSKLYSTARTVTSRRGQEWTPAQQAMWDEVFTMTEPARNDAIKKGRRLLHSQHT